MTLYGSLFYLLGAIILGSTVMTVASRNLVHAVVYLVISFLGTAMLFYLLGAPMIAALEEIIYAGAIMVLFLLVIMLMADANQEGPAVLRQHGRLLAGLIVPSFALVVFFVLVDPGRFAALQTAAVPAREFGYFVFRHYWLAVEIASFLLFVALVGAYYLGRTEKTAGDGREAV